MTNGHYKASVTLMSDLTSAYILHVRPFRDTSVIVELFDEQGGRFSVIARGVKNKKSPLRGIIQPFNKLLVQCHGRNELKKLIHAEMAGAALNLTGHALYCGFYLNELLMRLLTRFDAHPALFALYDAFLVKLKAATSNPDLEASLRGFEWQLLQELGYGFSLEYDGMSDEHILSEGVYAFQADQGFILCHDIRENTPGLQLRKNQFPGHAIVAWSRLGWGETQYRQDAKRLMRLALAPHLGDKPLASRELFRRHYSAEQIKDTTI